MADKELMDIDTKLEKLRLEKERIENAGRMLEERAERWREKRAEAKQMIKAAKFLMDDMERQAKEISKIMEWKMFFTPYDAIIISYLSEGWKNRALLFMAGLEE